MGLLERCEELYKTSDLYKVLGINKDAAEAEIRRGYYKLSLKVHPDRSPEDPLATEKFQVLGKLYAVLSDKDQRAVYDEQGVVDEESDVLSQDNDDWEDYWRQLFPGITLQDILKFEKKYKGSDEERQDVIQLYVQHQGNMDVIIQYILCFTQEEEPRICSIIQAAIDSGDVEAFPAFTQESEKKKRARRKRADRERREVEEMKKERGIGDDSLEMMLQKNQKAREQQYNSLLSNLEAKYCKKSEKSKKGKKAKK